MCDFGYAQCSTAGCPTEIEVCSYGENIIAITGNNGSYSISFLSENSSGFTDPIEGILFNNIFTYTSNLTINQVEQGTYRIACSNGNFCWGQYTMEPCVDYINFEGCREADSSLCSPEYIVNEYTSTWTRQVCLGDTSIVSFGDFEPNKGYIAEPFHPDRIECPLGEIVDYTENEFKIVWTAVGRSCVTLSTTTMFGSLNLTGINVLVSSIEAMQVSSNKGDSLSATICVGEEIDLFVESSYEIIPIWQVEGSVYYGLENTLSFDQPGEYTIQISNQDLNECNCMADSYYTIIVEGGYFPTIDCKRTVCLGEATTYYSVEECESYFWDVSPGGSILEGGGQEDSYITVQWDAGPIEEISLSTPSCSEDVCKETVTETINIITPTVDIEGSDVVCPIEIYKYSAPNFTGTNFFWDIGQHGEIVQGQGTNTVQVRWNPLFVESMALVSVTYESCTIGCGGSAQLPVTILPRLEIEHSTTDLCRDSEYTFSASPDIEVDWVLKDENGNITAYPTASSLTFSLANPGVYVLEIVDNSSVTCNSSTSLTLEVLGNIPLIDNLIGPKVICVGKTSKYSIPGLSNVELVSWEIIDGGASVNHGLSKSLLYTWSSNGPYEISVTVLNTLTGCESMRSTFLLNNDISLIGSSENCAGDEAEYSLPEYRNEEVNWSISPPSAGTIVESRDDWSRVIWREEGTHKISAFYCELNLEIDVSVRDNPTSSLSYDNLICQNEFSLLNISTDTENSIEIYKTNDSLLSTSASETLPAGDYYIVVSSPFGCSSEKYISINNLDYSEIFINSLNPLGVCPPFNPFEIFIEAVSSNYTYQWLRDGNVVGGNQPSLMVDELGTYSLTVTDKNGCQITSNNLEVFLCCSGPSNPTDIPEVIMDVANVDCNNMEFEILEPFQSTNFDWEFGDPFSGSNFASGISVSHSFSRAGTYLVKAVGDAFCDIHEVDVCGELQNQNLCEGAEMYVDVPLVADFSFELDCINETVNFIDMTTVLPTIENVNYSWEFGDPTSNENTSNEQTPSHIFSAPGTYMVTLETTAAGVCASSVTKEIEILDKPQLTIQAQTNTCEASKSIFIVLSTAQNLIYEWDFGDPVSGINNRAFSAFTEHIYSSFGNFTVTLTATDEYGCKTTITQEIEVLNNNLEGAISTDIPLPKCKDDVLTLTAPSEGTMFLWSTGDSTSSIQVTEEGSYSVTIVDDQGCEYTPREIEVFNYDISSLEIYANKNGKVIYDSLDVCIGDPFQLQVPPLSNATYSWGPVVDEDEILEYEDHFSNLTPGRYLYNVTIADVDKGCTNVMGPFIINLHEALEKPIIISEDASNCENNLITLKVDSYDPNKTYIWSNGPVGESITVYSSGGYRVTVIDQFGCESISDAFIVNPAPGANEWMTGCMEVCFPHEFCLNLNDNNQYNLIYNGSDIGPLTNASNTIDISQPGDYQLLVTNEYGCQSMSEILSLAASPLDQTLYGVVFLDENENSIFDGNDIYQAGVIVYLMNGNTIVAETITDINGFYSFDPVFQSNLSVVLDKESIDFFSEGVTDSTLIYDFCIEDKTVDFPLTSLCVNSIRVDTFYTCPDQPIIIEGNIYNVNDADTTIISLNTFCDSTQIINVLAYEEPDFDMETLPSCTVQPNGELMINPHFNQDLEFSLTPDFSEVNTLHSDLEAGSYTLYVRSDEGCNYTYPFTIDAVDEPEFELIATNTCENQSNGTLEIDVIQGVDLLFSLELDADYSDQQIYTGLEEGIIQVFVKDSMGCIYSDEVIIENFNSPQVNLVQEVFCEGDDFASVFVEVVDGNPFLAIDDPALISTETVWESLSIGPHVLYIESQFGCLDSIEFTIEPVPVPEVSIIAYRACENLDLGWVEVFSDVEELEFSITGVQFTPDIVYEDLAAGSYSIFVKTVEGCVFEEPFDIELFAPPELQLNPQSTCENNLDGALEISSMHIDDLWYSLDGSNFSPNTVFENLDTGTYILHYQSLEGDCTYEHPFEISSFPVPEIAHVQTNPCGNTSTGTIDISTDSDSNLSFDINGDGIFEHHTFYDNLPQGEYSIIVKDVNECTYEYLVSMISLPDPEFMINIENSCENLNNGSFTILSDDTDILTSINGSPFENVLSYDNLEADIYEISIMKNNGCVKSQIVEIQNNPPLEVALEEFSDCYESAFQIQPIVSSSHGELHYLWNTQDTSESILAFESGNYEVTITDICDEQFLSADINISSFNENNPVQLANVFSPNEDNVNDCLTVTPDANYEILTYSLNIYDRWGNHIFKTSDINGCWDGRFNNQYVVPGVYIYIVEMTVDHCNAIRPIKKLGDITVLR